MKKLLMLFIIAAMTGVVGAAQFDWKLQTGTDYADCTVYTISGTTAALFFEACKSTDANVWTAAFDGLIGSTNKSGSGARLAFGDTTTGIEGSDNLVFVLVKGEIAEGSTYTVLNDYTINPSDVYTPPSSGPIASIKLADLGIAGSGEFVGIPEPTSGVLLLLGIAGLALKRKHV